MDYIPGRGQSGTTFVRHPIVCSIDMCADYSFIHTYKKESKSPNMENVHFIVKTWVTFPVEARVVCHPTVCSIPLCTDYSFIHTYRKERAKIQIWKAIRTPISFRYLPYFRLNVGLLPPVGLSPDLSLLTVYCNQDDTITHTPSGDFRS